MTRWKILSTGGGEGDREERDPGGTAIRGGVQVEGKGTTYALMFASNVYDYYADLVNPVLDAQTIAMELGESYGVVSEVVLNPTLAETATVLREYASRKYEPGGQPDGVFCRTRHI